MLERELVANEGLEVFPSDYVLLREVELGVVSKVGEHDGHVNADD